MMYRRIELVFLHNVVLFLLFLILQSAMANDFAVTGDKFRALDSATMIQQNASKEEISIFRKHAINIVSERVKKVGIKAPGSICLDNVTVVIGKVLNPINNEHCCAVLLYCKSRVTLSTVDFVSPSDREIDLPSWNAAPASDICIHQAVRIWAGKRSAIVEIDSDGFSIVPKYRLNPCNKNNTF